MRVGGGRAGLAARPRRLNTLVKTDGNSRGLERLAPYTASFPLPRRGQRLYLCHAGRCAPPVEDRHALERLLAEARITVEKG